MDTFVSRKRQKIEKQDDRGSTTSTYCCEEQQSTDEKLAILASIFEDASQENLLEALLSNDGAVDQALDTLLATSAIAQPSPTRKSSTSTNIQSALKFTRKSTPSTPTHSNPPSRPLTKKGRTLYLYSPTTIPAHTPCSIIHNFLPPQLATALLSELLPETTTYTSATFRLFDNIVKSPHTASFYVNSLAEAQTQKSSYLYNGSTLSDIREILPVMREVSERVREAVNEEIGKRIASHYPDGKKLRYQPVPGAWKPNAAFVNCYNGPQQSVGYHTDQLTYLGPHPTIGSLSLGVTREFRIRRIVPPPDLDTLNLTPDSPAAKKLLEAHADAQGQISLPLPHNSLLIMHAEMQEEWKHSIAPCQSISPHEVAGNKRVNITYRWYREEFGPEWIPKCRCGVPTVLKSIMKREGTRGRYVWMCQTQGTVEAGEKVGKAEEKKGCGYFVWAEFDDDGVPVGSGQGKKQGKDVTT